MNCLENKIFTRVFSSNEIICEQWYTVREVMTAAAAHHCEVSFREDGSVDFVYQNPLAFKIPVEVFRDGERVCGGDYAIRELIRPVAEIGARVTLADDHVTLIYKKDMC